MERLFRKNAMTRKTVFLAVVFLWGACAKDPIWLPEFRALLEYMNSEFEEVLPSLTQDTSTEILYVGLRRLDKSSDRMVNDLGAFLEKYPYILKEKITIAFHLRKQLDQLGKNLNKAFAAGIAWDKRIGHQKEFRKLGTTIVRKVDKARALLNVAELHERE